MRKLQFSLLGLLCVVSFVAVGCAALAKPNEWWAMFVTNATFAALFVGVLAAIYGHAARRAFWVGFAVVGWGYLVVGWANGVLSISRPDDAQAFVTTRLLDWLGERTLQETTPQVAITMTPPPQSPVPVGLPPPVVIDPFDKPLPVPPATQQYDKPLQVPPATQPYLQSFVTYLGFGVDQQAMSRFMHIGHSLWAIVLAVAGGLLARGFHFRRERLADQRSALLPGA